MQVNMDEEDEPGRKIGKYTVVRSIGEGSFGEVFEAIDESTGEVVAIKELDKNRVQARKMGPQLQKEINILKSLRHDQVVQLKEVLASQRSIFMVNEYVGGGDLHRRIAAERRLDEQKAARLPVTQEALHGAPAVVVLR